MDPELLKDRLDFKRRASALPTVSSRIAKPQASVDDADASQAKKAKLDKKKKQSSGSARPSSQFDYKTATSANAAARFTVLHKIVDYMKKRHLTGKDWVLALEEILHELNMFDVDKKSKEWLNADALPKNPRLTRDSSGKYLYKPPYKVKGKNSLLAVLKRHDMDGKGGILLSELADSMANTEKSLDMLGDEVIVLPTNIYKRKDKVVFYNDKDSVTPVNEEFLAMWRGVPMEHLDEAKIEEYLEKNGITSMTDSAMAKKKSNVPKRKQSKRKANIVHNSHMEGVLQDFSSKD